MMACFWQNIWPPGSFEAKDQSRESNRPNHIISHHVITLTPVAGISGVGSPALWLPRPNNHHPIAQIYPLYISASFELAVSSRFTRQRFASLVTVLSNFTRTGNNSLNKKWPDSSKRGRRPRRRRGPSSEMQDEEVQRAPRRPVGHRSRNLGQTHRRGDDVG